MTKKNNLKTKSIEETLWQACDNLRGSVESSEYKHVVLGLIFLKFASDKFEKRKKNTHQRGAGKIYSNERILQYGKYFLFGRNLKMGLY